MTPEERADAHRRFRTWSHHGGAGRDPRPLLLRPRSGAILSGTSDLAHRRAIRGRTSDIHARLFAQARGARRGKVIVENVTGAGGTVAAACVARPQPDGYALRRSLGRHPHEALKTIGSAVPPESERSVEAAERLVHGEVKRRAELLERADMTKEERGSR